jgi:hypothetical protein
MAFKNYRDASKENWGKDDPYTKNPEDIGLNLDQINTGAFLRIADATEAMAKNHIELQAAYDRMRESRDVWMRYSDKKANQINSMKSLVSRLKNQIKTLKNAGHNDRLQTKA